MGRKLLTRPDYSAHDLLCKKRSTQERFVENLFYTLDHEAPITLILTLRADFYHKCDSLPALRTALEQHQKYIGAMSDEELRRAIELPARQGKWEFETGLVNLLLEDAGNEPGNLPLLSHALHETWQRRSVRTLTFAGYVASGRIQGAIARTADRTYANLSEEDKQLARLIFIELTELGEGTQDTRRRVLTTRLLSIGNNPERVEGLLKTLADARLISTDKETTEVSHEALIREWTTLRQWVDAVRVWVRFRRELSEDVHRWKSLNKDKSSLYGGARLAWALAEVKGKEGELYDDEWEFLAESQRHEGEEHKSKQEGEERRRRNILLTRFAWALAGLLVLAIGLALVGYQQSVIAGQERQFALNAQATSTINEGRAISAQATSIVNEVLAIGAQADAESARRETLSLRLAAESANLLVDTQYSLALLTAIEAAQRPLKNGEVTPPETVEHLHNILGNRLGLPLVGHSERIYTLAFSPDGNWLATGSGDTTVKLWNLNDSTANSIALMGHSNTISTLAFSPNGKWLATGSWDTTVKLWNMDDPLASPITLTGHSGGISNLAISQDGGWLATGSWDDTAKLWNLNDLTATPITLEGHLNDVTALTFSPDGHTLATKSRDSNIMLWNLDIPTSDPISLGAHPGSLAFSPDGQYLATGGGDSTKLWNLDNPTTDPITLTVKQAEDNKSEHPLYAPTATPTVPGGYSTDITTLAFSSDGHWLATSSRDDIVNLWNLDDPSTSIMLKGHSGNISTLSFSLDGHWLATGSDDATVNLWNLNDLISTPVTLAGHSGTITTLAFSPNGKWIATGSSDTVAKLWNLDGLIPDPTSLTGHSAHIFTLAFSPDRNWLATGGADNTLNLWNLNDLSADPVTLAGHSRPIWTVAFSPDGQWLAASSGSLFSQNNTDTTVNLWNLDNLTVDPIPLAGHSGPIFTLAFSPDGQWLATASGDTTAKLWNLSDLSIPPITLTGHSAFIWALAFSADSQWLATASGDTTAKLWNLSDLTTPPITFAGHSGPIWALAFSADSQWLATASDDTTAKLWNLNDLTATPITFAGDSGPIFTLALSPDGHWLATSTGNIHLFAGDNNIDYTARLWSLDDPTAPPISLTGHAIDVTALAFSPNGDWLATASGDSTVKLWNLNDLTASPITLAAHFNTVSTLAFSPDDKWLATGSWDTTAKLWTLPIDQLIDKACALTGRNITREEWQNYFAEEPYRPTCPQWATPPEK